MQFILLYLDLRSQNSLPAIFGTDEKNQEIAKHFSSCCMERLHELKLVPGTKKTKEAAFINLIKIVDLKRLKEDIKSTTSSFVVPAIYKEIERCFFEKTFWSTALKKCGGMYKSFIHNLIVFGFFSFNWKVLSVIYLKLR